MIYVVTKKANVLQNAVDPAVLRDAATPPVAQPPISEDQASALSISAFMSHLYQINAPNAQSIGTLKINNANVHVVEGDHYTLAGAALSFQQSGHVYFTTLDGKVLQGDSAMTASGLVIPADQEMDFMIRNESCTTAPNPLVVTIINQGIQVKGLAGTVLANYVHPQPFVAADTLTIAVVGNTIVVKMNASVIYTKNLTVQFTMSSASLGVLSSAIAHPMDQPVTLTVGNTANTYTLQAQDQDGNLTTQTFTVNAGAGGTQPPADPTPPADPGTTPPATTPGTGTPASTAPLSNEVLQLAILSGLTDPNATPKANQPETVDHMKMIGVGVGVVAVVVFIVVVIYKLLKPLDTDED